MWQIAGAIVALWAGVYIATLIILWALINPHSHMELKYALVACAFNATAWVLIVASLRGLFS